MKGCQFLRKIKQEFRYWYGLLSFEEILSNTQLIELIGAIEAHKEFQNLERGDA